MVQGGQQPKVEIGYYQEGDTRPVEGTDTRLQYIEVYNPYTQNLVGQWTGSSGGQYNVWNPKSPIVDSDHANRTVNQIENDQLTDSWVQTTRGFHVYIKRDANGNIINTS